MSDEFVESPNDYFDHRDIIYVNTTEQFLGAEIGPQLLSVHHPDKCEGRPCTIHNPSDHHMVTWPQNWRADKGMMERKCQHGVGHPDPDDYYVKQSPALGIHGCDGCCQRSKNG